MTDKRFVAQIRYIGPFTDYLSLPAKSEEDARKTLEECFKEEAHLSILRIEEVDDEDDVQELIDGWSETETAIQ